MTQSNATALKYGLLASEMEQSEVVVHHPVTHPTQKLWAERGYVASVPMWHIEENNLTNHPFPPPPLAALTSGLAWTQILPHALLTCWVYRAWARTSASFCR